MKKLGKKPVIPILHHMARSGGTIISKCLACMEKIALLSEIHPYGYKKQYINPLAQAHQWFGLLNPGDIARIQNGPPPSFADAVELIKRRCDERGLALVIRDWSHLDFTGWPHVSKPAYKLTTAKTLSRRFKVISSASVRHPIDQWLSFRESQSWTGKELTLDRYLYGYRKFAEQAAKIGYVRYEDFTDEPALILEKLCNKLGIPFDPLFNEKWNDYKWITTATRARDGGSVISNRPRRHVDAELLESFSRNKDYRFAVELLGYGHPF